MLLPKRWALIDLNLRPLNFAAYARAQWQLCIAYKLWMNEMIRKGRIRAKNKNLHYLDDHKSDYAFAWPYDGTKCGALQARKENLSEVLEPRRRLRTARFCENDGQKAQVGLTGLIGLTSLLHVSSAAFSTPASSWLCDVLSRCRTNGRQTTPNAIPRAP